MKRVLTFIFSLGFVFLLNAQERIITGVVTAGDSKEPLPGVTVVIQGTSSGVITDLDGNYSIKASENNELTFSFVGYLPETITVGDQTVVDITLIPDIMGLEEVVVIGYGTVKKEDLTGAVSVVEAQTLADLKPVKVEQALQGTMAGVNVTNQSGAPGAGLGIRIRGVSTKGDASPISIIEGYEGELSTLNSNEN